MLCKEFCNVFGPGDHASTYGGNPLACAAGVAVAHAIDHDQILENTIARGNQLRALAEAMKAKYPEIVSDVRGWGLISGIEISEQSSLMAADFAKALMEDGVLVVPAGPKVIRFVPPLIVSESEVASAMGKLESCLVKLVAAAKK